MSAASQAKESEFKDTPEDWGKRWKLEIDHAKKWLERWHKDGKGVVEAYLDDREGTAGYDDGVTRWNLFWSNVTTQRALMYGQTPRVSVDRRFADARDDQARVAAETLERALNSDIEKDGDTYAEALAQALEDRLLPGLGQARVRYEVETEEVEGQPPILNEDGTEKAQAVPAGERISYECVETDYVHWRDFLWSPARTWKGVRWVAFHAEMSRAQLKKRFGEDVAKFVPMRAGKSEREDDDERKEPTPWDRASVFEIWDKETKTVYWFCDGHPRILDKKKDPLGLQGFFPCPRPMLANCTTTKLVPRPDYMLAKALYEEVNVLSTRIRCLEHAVAVRGVYDASSPSVKRVLSDAAENALIPVENWAMFAEKGGIKGQVDWLPIEQVVGVLTQLVQQRQVVKDALFEITGMADLMRGQAAQAGASATEQSIKAKFGSVRMQALQDEFARFASDLQRLKAEIMAKRFQPESIIRQSNIEHTPDAPMAQQAVSLIKDRFSAYRIQVKPEAVSMQDFAALKAESMEVITGVSGFMQASAPVVQMVPGSLPFLLQILQWGVARIRGAGSIEGVLDQAIAAAEQAQQQAAQNPQQQPPDSKLLAQQMKGQQDQQKIKAELEADIVRTQVELQADAQREQNQAMWNTREAQQKAMLGAAQGPKQQQPAGGRRP